MRCDMYPYFQIFGRLIGVYGVCLVAGVLLTGALSSRRYRAMGLPAEDIYIVGAIALGIALVCGNLLYIAVTYSFDYVWTHILAGDFSFVGSGIVFYGGLIGGILGAFLGVRIANCKFSSVLEAVIPFVPLGHAIGRIGCLMAGCCYGMEYYGPLAVYYPNSVLNLSPETGYFPVQLLESAINLIICGILLQLKKCLKDKKMLLPAYLCMYACSRFCLEFLRGDKHRGIYFGISLSQWISVGLLLVSAAGITFFAIKSRRSDGV